MAVALKAGAWERARARVHGLHGNEALRGGVPGGGRPIAVPFVAPYVTPFVTPFVTPLAVVPARIRLALQ